MDDRTGNIAEVKFTQAQDYFSSLETEVIPELVSRASDFVLVIDSNNVIKDSSFNSTEIYQKGGRGWMGHDIFETVTSESKGKISKLLNDVREDNIQRSYEVNQKMLEGDDMPVIYKGAKLDDNGHIVLFGQNNSRIGSLQRRLMSSQLSMEREVSKLRSSESRFRALFKLSDLAQMVIDASDLSILDINPAAVKLLGKTNKRLENKKFLSFFNEAESSVIHKLLLAAINDGSADQRTVKLANGEELTIDASLFRQDGKNYLLAKLSNQTDKIVEFTNTVERKVLELVKQMPDAFVVTNSDRQIITANPAFFELVHVSDLREIEGTPFDTFFERPNVDCNVLLANVKEHGIVRRFATVMHSRYSQLVSVEIASCQLEMAGEKVLGFWLRPTNNLVLGAEVEQENISRSNEQISNLVGHMPLKDIVRETTEMIEKLCIETALELTQNNRASAAQMLGLSRQSLYSKLSKEKD